MCSFKLLYDKALVFFNLKIQPNPWSPIKLAYLLEVKHKPSFKITKVRPDLLFCLYSRTLSKNSCWMGSEAFWRTGAEIPMFRLAIIGNATLAFVKRLEACIFPGKYKGFNEHYRIIFDTQLTNCTWKLASKWSPSLST